jgi:LmbE family N-acetylglucosaminyl deacetylase
MTTLDSGIIVYTYKPFKFTLFDNRPRILILCAHPDDESIFDSRDLLHNNCTVICLTNAQNRIRRREFLNVMQFTKQTGYILNFPDSISENGQEHLWFNLTDEEIYKLYISQLLNNKYDLVVSHDRYGEYGHPQHKRLHELSLYIASQLKIPFNDFQTRYIDEAPEEKKKADNIRKYYISQKVVVEGSKKDLFRHKRCKN